MFGVALEAFMHSLHKNNTLIFIFEVDIRESLLVLMEDDCYISFGDSPKFVVATIRDMETKLFHDRDANNVCNPVGYPSFKILTKNVFSIFGLEVGNSSASITVAIQMCTKGD